MQHNNIKVFLSYAKDDAICARRLVQDLANMNIEVSYDENFLLPGQRWKIEIKKAIKKSDFFIALISSNSIAKRGFIQREMKVALDVLDEIPESDIYFIPVRLDECSPSHDKLNDIHWVDLFPKWNEGVKRIAKAIRPEISSDKQYSLPKHFQPLIDDAIKDFVGREYIFHEIDSFIANNHKGYLIIHGDPGMGKTALLAKYVHQNDCVAYFNERLLGRNRSSQFLESICMQLITNYNLPYTSLPDKATKDGGFFMQLINQIGSRLSSKNNLVIAIDALDEVDLTIHTSGANILYLPERLPDHVYLIMTRRRMDFLPLRISAPHLTLDLLDYHNDSHRDIQTYIRNTLEDPTLHQIRSWIARQTIETEEFVTALADKSEDNFMYLYHVLDALNNGKIYHNRNIDNLPVGLQGYYKDHWRHMRGLSGDEIWFNFKLPVIVALTVAKKPISIELIEEFTKISKRARIRSVLEEWSQFLRKLDVYKEDSLCKYYRLYHASFHDFVASLEEIEDERVNLKRMHGQIADTLWDELFGDA